MVQSMQDIRRALPSGILGYVYNKGAIGPYGQRYDDYVQMAEAQAWMHQGYWQTEEDVVDQKEREVLHLFGLGVDELIASNDPRAVRQYVDQILDVLYEAVSEYPPERPTSNYIRTRTLFMGWTSELKI